MPRSTEKLDLATRAAWLYYVAGNTQNEIAEKLQVSRPVAQRLVAFAVEKNLIRVRVDHKLADCLSLADQLSKRYGLSMRPSGTASPTRRFFSPSGRFS